MAVRFTHSPTAQRFEACVDDSDVAVGFAEYRQHVHALDFVRTEVRPEHAGQGIAGELVRACLDHAREHDLLVIPTCSYFAGWIARHPEYADLMAPT